MVEQVDQFVRAQHDLLRLTARGLDGVQGLTQQFLALRRNGELYAIEESIRGKPPDERRAARPLQAKALLDGLERWLHTTLAALSRKSETAAAISYARSSWPALPHYADDGRIGIDNSAAKRAIRDVALTYRQSSFELLLGYPTLKPCHQVDRQNFVS